MKRILIVLTMLLSATAMLRAQGYGTYEQGRYHYSSVYYATLQGAAGEDLTSRYAEVDGAIGAFVGGELRGTSKVFTLNNGPATHAVQIFVIRVWGDEHDPATVSFRLKGYGVEYVLDTADFGRDADMTYGSPTIPLLFTFVPVTGIDLSPYNVSVLLGGTQTVSARLAPSGHTPLAASTPLDIKFTNYGAEHIFSITQQPPADPQQPTVCTIKGLSRGTGTLFVSATRNDTIFYSASAQVSVLTNSVAVTGIRNDMPSLNLEQEVGDDFQLRFTVLPENATNRQVTYEIGDPTIVYDTEDEFGTTFHALKRGETTIKVTTVDGGYTLLYHVRVGGEVEELTLTYPDELTLSKLRDVTVTFTTEPASARVHAELVEIVISQSENDGWGPAATAKAADGTGRRWLMRGLYAGTYSYSVKYNGQPMKTDKGQASGKLHIPAEYAFDSGWDWISLYAAPASGSIMLKTGDNSYLSTLQFNADNKVIEIRSQHALLSNDPELGFFGTLDALTPEDGAYKIYSQHSEANTAAMAFNAGYDGLRLAADMELPLIHKGYTWITYPHELDHTVKALDSYLSVGACDGDQIIGRDGFTEYNGFYWEAPASFRFRAGKGYVYYTEDDGGRKVNWGPATLPPDEEVTYDMPVFDSLYDTTSEIVHGHSVHSLSSDVMPVVASLGDINTSEDYVILAFVDGCLRGTGQPVSSPSNQTASLPHVPLFHITVAGQQGETVCFCLYNKMTRQYQQLPQTLAFSKKAGSHRQPIVLGTHLQGIQEVDVNATPGSARMSNHTYDLLGRTMRSGTEPAPTGHRRIGISNGRIVITH